MDDVTIRRLAPDSDECRLLRALRAGVLREPLGLASSETDVAAEAEDLHFAAWLNGELAGGVLLRRLDPHCVQLRQMAVAREFQCRGVGAKLARAAEAFAQDGGYGRIELHARKTAVGFYARLGYEAGGEEFLEVTIPHLKMAKTIPR